MATSSEKAIVRLHDDGFREHPHSVSALNAEVRIARSPLANETIIVDRTIAIHTNEAATRGLGLSVRTYRRRIAEITAALGANSRFQGGTRAQELGLV